ncbi:SDR family NAD(P)-dependent oxidoreductase [uncultured Kiloniella sp.]|uniref:SDR family NAD(P)-dependent oxidoreductase n=1 Tax=uncultured Kiloniella sp. TaxID=1133091 RepID=UPI002605E16F|nr:SDR family NAD(P)-dependent oxidoreductase [uncultured Kiloniella sp.]
MIKSFKGAHIWILGASSGIGLALTHELSNAGAILALSSRRRPELNDINEALGGQHLVVPCDASIPASIEEASDRIEQSFPRIDSAIYMAGYYNPTKFEDFELEELRKTIDINLTGAFVFAHHVLKVLRKQKAGQIVLCASVAGFRGLPNGQPYSATKAGMINMAESLRIENKNPAIDIKVINPGFVRTPMTDKNPFKMPMIIEPEDAAKAIATGLRGNTFEIHFPKKFTYFLKLIKILPGSVYFKLFKNQ